MAWFLYVLLTGTLLAVAAFALDTMLRRNRMPTRWVWVATLVGIAGLAVAAPRASAPFAIRLDQVSITGPVALQPTQRPPGILDVITQARAASRRSLSTALVAAERQGSSLAAPLGLVWVVTTGALLSLLVIVMRRANSARRRWPRAEVQGTPVRIAPGVGPAVVGLTHPDIVLPGWLMERPEDEQALVVMHEREHVAARDQLLPIAAWIVAALLPWHPAVWWSMSRLRLAIELDCDARVLHRGVKLRSYGTLLIDIAGQCAGHRIGALALADRPSHLERRLLAMKSSRTRIGIVRALTLTGIAALAVVAACEARLPTSAELDGMDATAISAAASKSMSPSKVAGESTEFYLNDKKVAESELRELKASLIANVNVKKTETGKAVFVNTLTPTPMLAKKVSGEPIVVMDMAAPKDTAVRGLRMKTSEMSPSKTVFDGLIVIDGVPSTDAQLAALNRDAIVSIEVTKGAAASALYPNTRAANGVIKVVTKAGAKQ